MSLLDSLPEADLITPPIATLAPGEKIELNVSAAPASGAFTWCINGFERDTGD